jgi:hypothetical protein
MVSQSALNLPEQEILGEQKLAGGDFSWKRVRALRCEQEKESFRQDRIGESLYLR